MAYFTLLAKVEEVDESSYTARSGEVIHKVQFSLVVPGMRDRVLCEMAQAAAPKTDTCERWELEEAWVAASANSMRALGFERKNAREGEAKAGALVVFQLAEIREATADERRQLQQQRKADKLRVKAERAKRAEEKKAAKEAEEQRAAAAGQAGQAGQRSA